MGCSCWQLHLVTAVHSLCFPWEWSRFSALLRFHRHNLEFIKSWKLVNLMEGEVNLMWRIWLLECVCWFCCGASLSFCHLQSLLFSNKAVFLLLCASPSFCLAFCVRSLVHWGSTAASLRQHTDDLIALDFWCLLLSDLPHGYFWTVLCPQTPWWHYQTGLRGPGLCLMSNSLYLLCFPSGTAFY